jgi:FkbM family methyltransferase
MGFADFAFIDNHCYNQYLTEQIFREQYLQRKEYWDDVMSDNWQAIANVRSVFADDLSREIFDAAIAVRFKQDYARLDKYAQRPEYYPNGIIGFDCGKTEQAEVFVDCGAYDGGSVSDFIEHCPNYEYIYSFEPDPLQYVLAKAYLESKRIERCELHNLDVWSGIGEIPFNSVSGGGSGIVDELTAYNKISTTNIVPVKTIDLDGLLYDCVHRPTYIKMDVEGAESAALKGAKKIIERDKPKLAVCVYHKPADIWEIPQWIMTCFPDYKFYLRQHAAQTDTVLYAV